MDKKWWFSIAMLNYQRVTIFNQFETMSRNHRMQQHPWSSHLWVVKPPAGPRFFGAASSIVIFIHGGVVHRGHTASLTLPCRGQISALWGCPWKWRPSNTPSDFGSTCRLPPTVQKLHTQRHSTHMSVWIHQGISRSHGRWGERPPASNVKDVKAHQFLG